MVKINLKIKLTNKWLYSLIAVGIFLVLTIGVFAYNSGLSPSIMGHDLSELEVIEQEGTVISLEQWIENKIGGPGIINCDIAPIYNSLILTEEANGQTGVAYNDQRGKYQNGEKAISASCKTGTGCILKQEIYYLNRGVEEVKLTRQYGFNQYNTNKWWSSYSTSGTYTNGDRSLKDIIPPYGSLYLRDDAWYSTTGYSKEEDRNKFTFIDRSGSYGMKVYICSEPLAEEV